MLDFIKNQNKFIVIGLILIIILGISSGISAYKKNRIANDPQTKVNRILGTIGTLNIEIRQYYSKNKLLPTDPDTQLTMLTKTKKTLKSMGLTYNITGSDTYTITLNLKDVGINDESLFKGKVNVVQADKNNVIFNLRVNKIGTKN